MGLRTVKILFLTHRLPYAPNRGDRIRAYHLLRQLAGLGQVDLVSLVHDRDEAGHADDLRDMCASVSLAPVVRPLNLLRGLAGLAGPRPLTHSLLASPRMAGILSDLVARRRPDVVVAFCSGMARYAIAPPLRHIPCILDLVDVDSEKWRALAETAGPLMRWIYRREHRTLSAFEREAATAAACTLVVNDRERQLLSRLAPEARVQTVLSGVDVEHFRPTGPPRPSATLVFTGVMDYAPNIDAVTWMAREVWPLVHAARPDARFQIVGARPTPAVRHLEGDGVVVTGTVPDTRPYLWEAAVGVAPLLLARGIQNKVLEAVAAGLPVVTTRVVADGLPGEVMAAVDVVDGPRAFADAVLARLAESPEARRRRAGAADLGGLGWHTRLAPIPGLVRSAASRA